MLYSLFPVNTMSMFCGVCKFWDFFIYKVTFCPYVTLLSHQIKKYSNNPLIIIQIQLSQKEHRLNKKIQNISNMSICSENNELTFFLKNKLTSDKRVSPEITRTSKRETHCLLSYSYVGQYNVNALEINGSLNNLLSTNRFHYSKGVRLKYCL